MAQDNATIIRRFVDEVITEGKIVVDSRSSSSGSLELQWICRA